MSYTLKIIAAVLLCFAAGALGSVFVRSPVQGWYAELVKPSFNPPSWIFGVVWPVLYLLMGIAAGIVWNEGIDKKEVRIALSFFAFQLVLNALWTPIFFGLHLIALALADILILWLAIVGSIVTFWNVSRISTVLLIPYILWVTFAAVLNASFLFLNR